MKTTMIRPTGNRLVVKMEEKPEHTGGGLTLSVSMKNELPNYAQVLSVGSGKLLTDGTRETMEVAEGDRVILSQYFSGTKITVEDEEVVIVTEQDVLAIC